MFNFGKFYFPPPPEKETKKIKTKKKEKRKKKKEKNKFRYTKLRKKIVKTTAICKGHDLINVYRITCIFSSLNRYQLNCCFYDESSEILVDDSCS